MKAQIEVIGCSGGIDFVRYEHPDGALSFKKTMLADDEFIGKFASGLGLLDYEVVFIPVTNRV